MREQHALSSRPERIDEGAGWTYDDDTPGEYGIGRVASILDPMGSATYRYDRRGLVVSEDRTIMDLASGEICLDCIREYVTQYRYDADGNRAAVIYPSGRAIDYTYDYAGRPTSATALVTSATYLPFGPLKTLSYGNGTTQTWTFDARYRPVTNQVTAGAATLASYSYGHDAAGNITAITDAQDPTYNRTFVTTFAYQGTTPKLTSSATTGLTPETVTYDAAGNETTSKYGRTFSPRNLMSMRLGPVTAQKDGYDARGVRVMSATQDRRIGGADAPFITSHYQYSPELNLLSTSTDVHQKEIVWFAGRPVAQFDTDEQSTTLRYTATDHLGTPFLQTDPAAQPVWRAEYDPYGTIAQMRTGTEATQPLRFPGQEAPLDGAESYNIFRWYRAEWGRYTQFDPFGNTYWPTVLSGKFIGRVPPKDLPRVLWPEAAHPYSYAANNALVNTDRLGLKVQSRGCDGVPDCLERLFPKFKNCCECHDRCFRKNDCNAARDWALTGAVVASAIYGPPYVPPPPCVQCNLYVVSCFATGLLGYAPPCPWSEPPCLFGCAPNQPDGPYPWPGEELPPQ